MVVGGVELKEVGESEFLSLDRVWQLVDDPVENYFVERQPLIKDFFNENIALF